MKTVILAGISLIVSTYAFAQTEKILLWPGSAPGTENRENTELVEPGGNVVRVHQPELTFFPAPNQTTPASAILVCPGGGYRTIVMAKEGVRIAEFFQKRGFTVFVLKYRLNPSEAVQDARRAIRVIRSQAAKYNIDPSSLGVVGFSAGGHLGANLSVNHTASDIADKIDAISARPDFCAPIYGVFEAPQRASLKPGVANPAVFDLPAIKDFVTETTPPMFIVHAVDDKTVPVEHSLNLFTALKAKGVPAELHLYEKCGHGFALDADRGYAASWGEAFLLWLKVHGVEPSPAARP